MKNINIMKNLLLIALLGFLLVQTAELPRSLQVKRGWFRRGPTTPCNLDTDCTGTDEFCHIPTNAPSGRCLKKKCTTATEATDCRPGDKCDETVFRCRPTYCSTSTDCPSGSICSNGRCKKACDSDNDCKHPNKMCEIATGECKAKTCTLDSDCTGFPRRCDTNT